MSRAVSRVLRKAGEPIQGLPEPLPAGEEILWQGSPDFRALSRSAFHANALGIYFAVLLAARGATVWSSSHSLTSTLVAIAWLAPLFLGAMAMVLTIAWLVSRTTVYTLTDKRVVMHIGVVLDLTLNLPYEVLDSVDLRLAADGSGDLPLRLVAPNKIAYLHLWPHARPWHVKAPEPMLRAVADAGQVGEILAKAIQRSQKVGQVKRAVAPVTDSSDSVQNFPIAAAS